MSDFRGQSKRKRDDEEVGGYGRSDGHGQRQGGESSKRSRNVYYGQGDQSQTQGLAPVVAKHYNELEERGLEARAESHIIFMRNFNNWIKSMLINEGAERLRNSHNLTILDMCCGKGGDIQKWLKLKTGTAGHVVFADIAETSVQQCKERYMNTKRQQENYSRRFSNQNKMFTAEFIVADCAEKRLQDQYSNRNFEFDLVSVQFSLHYAFETCEQAKMMLQNVSENLKPGGILIGTIPNACRIVRLLREAGGVSFGNPIFRIEFDTKEPFPLFGAKYYFQLEDLVNCPEFLVHFGTLVKLAKTFGLRLIFKHTFDEYFHQKLGDGKFLLERMQALETYPPFQGRKSAAEIQTEYAHAERFFSDESQGQKFGTLSKSEWEAVTLYIVFAFEKIAK